MKLIFMSKSNIYFSFITRSASTVYKESKAKCFQTIYEIISFDMKQLTLQMHNTNFKEPANPF